jgi:hypothetical protein
VNIVGNAQVNTAASGSSQTGVSIGRIDLGSLGDELSFDRAFTQPLNKLYANGHTESMLLLVDALDEAQPYTGVTLPDLLSRLDDLPADVRILITTRHEPEVLKFFRCIKPFDLIHDAEVDDVQSYAAQQLMKLTAFTEVKRNEFAERLGKEANGVFLYAAMVLYELLKRPQSELPDLVTYPLPKGLSGLYRRFLTRVLGNNLQRWLELYEPLLGLIAVAQGDGLTASQLKNIIGADIRPALVASNQYLNGEPLTGPFTMFHKSFADFLLEDRSNADYHIDAVSMHRRIAQYYLKEFDNRWELCDSYGLQHLAFHLRFGNCQKELIRLIKTRSWYQSRRCNSQPLSAYLSDVEHAWKSTEFLNEQRARQDIPNDLLPIYAEIDCALITSTFKGTIPPPELLAALLKEQLLSSSEALAYALVSSDETVKSSALAKLSNLIEVSLIPSLLSAARTLRDDRSRVEALSSVVPRLSKEDLDVVLRDVLMIKDEFWRARLLTALAPFLERDQIVRSLTIADSLPPNQALNFLRERVISALSKRLGELGDLASATAALNSITNAYCWVLCSASILPFLTRCERAQAVLVACRKALSIDDEIHRRDAFLALRPFIMDLEPIAREEWDAKSKRAITFSRNYGIPAPIVSILRFVDYLPEKEQVPALEMALGALDEMPLSDFRTQELYIELEKAFGKRGQLETALRIANKHPTFRLHLLPYLDGIEKSRVLADCLGWLQRLDKMDRLATLPLIAGSMSADERRETLKRALAETEQIGDKESLLEEAAGILPYVAKSGDVDAAVGMSIQLPPRLRSEALISIAEVITQPKSIILKEALRAAVSIEPLSASKPDREKLQKRRLLSILVSLLAEVGCIDEAISALSGLDYSDRESAIEEAAQFVAKKPQRILDYLLHDLGALHYSVGFSKLTALLIQELSSSDLKTLLSTFWRLGNYVRSVICIRLGEVDDSNLALRQVKEISDPYWQALTTLRLLPHLAKDSKQKIISSVRNMAEEIHGPLEKAEVLWLVSKYLDQHDSNTVRLLAIESAEEAVWDNPSALAKLKTLDLPITEAMLGEALRRASVSEESIRRVNFKELIRNLPGPLLELADSAVQKLVTNDYDRDELRCQIVIRLAELMYPEMALAKLQTLTRTEFRAQVVSQIGGYLNAAQLKIALAIALDLSDLEGQFWRARAFAGLARYLCEVDSLAIVIEASCRLLTMEQRRLTLQAISSRLSEMPRGVAYPLWARILRSVAQRSRLNLVSDLTALGSTISTLGGLRALRLSWSSIVEVESLWS